MILVKTLIVLLLMLILSHLIWKLNQKKISEGFQQQQQQQQQGIQSIAPNENIANELESAPTATTSQKAQARAQVQQTDEEDETIKAHQRTSQDAANMLNYKNQIDELLKLGDEAKTINESFK